jgi:ferredoxin
MDDKLRVTIDRAECISCATCWATCPEFFEESPDDYSSQVVEHYRVDGNPGAARVPEDLADCVQDAADGCPVQIIHVADG